MRKVIDTTRIGKNPARALCLAVQGPYGPHTIPARVFTSCLQYLSSYGARKLIVHTLKLYGPRTERQNPYGAARGPCGPREWTYDFCSKQPVNSPHGARECDVMPLLHHIPGHRMGCSRAVLNKHRTSTHGDRAAPYECRLPVRGPYSWHHMLAGPVRV